MWPSSRGLDRQPALPLGSAQPPLSTGHEQGGLALSAGAAVGEQWVNIGVVGA